MKDIMIFNNEEFGQVRTLTIENKPYFVGKDIAEILGYSRPTKAIQDHCKGVLKQRIGVTTGFKTDGTPTYQEVEMSLIPIEDVYTLIAKAKTASTLKKEKLIKELGLNNNMFVIETRKEIEFLDMLEKTLEPFDYTLVRQYKVLNYKIDLYIQDLNIAIEYDENNHINYSYEQHEGRQKEIEKELSCKFIRVSDKESNLYNIGLVMKKIMEVM